MYVASRDTTQSEAAAQQEIDYDQEEPEWVRE
jgi:hypothetical protein